MSNKDKFITIFSVEDINKSSFLHPEIYFHKTCMNSIYLRPQLLCQIFFEISHCILKLLNGDLQM